MLQFNLKVALQIDTNCCSSFLLGYWPFGTALCNFWVTSDVLFCTSSIIHLLFISVTRYIGTSNRQCLLSIEKVQMAFSVD